MEAPLDDFELRAMREREEAWYKVVNLVQEIDPLWYTRGKTGEESVLSVIRELAKKANELPK